MAQFFKNLSFFCVINLFSSSFATIVSMEEMFHPKIQQTVILNGDMHWKDTSQKDDLVDVIKKSKAYTIFEGHYDKNKECELNILLLGVLASSLKKQQLPCYNAEFRGGMSNLTILVLNSLRVDNYTECKELWQKEEFQDAIFGCIMQARDDGFAMLKEIAQDLSQLEVEKNCSAADIETLRTELDKIGALYNELRTDIHSALPAQKRDYETDRKALVDLLFTQAFARSEDDTVLHIRHCLDDKIVAMSDQLLDMRIIIHILKNKQEPVVFVCAGRKHTDNISNILSKIGYASLQEDRKDDVTIQDTIREISKKENVLAVFLYDHYRDHLTLNIQQFIAACKSLKTNPPADAAAAGKSF